MKANESSRLWHRKQQWKVFEHYGTSCLFCGESEPLFLTIDHINGGGNKEKKELGIYGDDFYEWLLQRNFPEGYQTLCMNCNQGKERDKGYSNIYYEIAKEKVYSLFPKIECACCGIDTLHFLSIDHINNDGARDRKEYGGAGLGYLNSIIRKEVPIENNLQLLCMNCNIGKMRNLGQCPHKGIVDRMELIPAIERHIRIDKGVSDLKTCTICGAPRTTPVGKGASRCEEHKWIRKTPRKPSEGRLVGDLRYAANRSPKYDILKKKANDKIEVEKAF